MVFWNVIVFVHLLVVLLSVAFCDLGEGGLREDAEEVPGDIETLEDGADVVGSLGDEPVLELVEELEVEQVFGRERLLADDGLHGLGVFADGVVGVELGEARVPGWRRRGGLLGSCLCRWRTS